MATDTAVKASRAVRHRGALAIFLLPFGVLFTLFYLVPILYAVYQSLLTVEREGTFGPAVQVFGGLTQYIQVFQNEPFWSSIGRVLLFGVVQVPIMLGLALILALLLDSSLVRGSKFFRLAFFAPYAVPSVIAAIMWGFLYSPNLSPFTAVTSQVDFLSAEAVLWSIANVVTWVYVGYNMLIIYSALLSIPQEIYEAARLDDQDPARRAGSRAHGHLLDHRHTPAAGRAAGVPELLGGGHERVHAQPDDLLHRVGAEHQPRRRHVGRARPGDLRALVHRAQAHPAEGSPMSVTTETRALRTQGAA